MVNSISYLIIRASVRIKAELSNILKPYDLTPEQWGLLNQLWQKDGVSQKELSTRTFKDQANITRILDKLEEKELIKREPTPSDRRVYLILVTEKGYALKNELTPLTQDLQSKTLKHLSKDAEKNLAGLLQQIIENLENENREESIMEP